MMKIPGQAGYFQLIPAIFGVFAFSCILIFWIAENIPDLIRWLNNRPSPPIFSYTDYYGAMFQSRAWWSGVIGLGLFLLLAILMPSADKEERKE